MKTHRLMLMLPITLLMGCADAQERLEITFAKEAPVVVGLSTVAANNSQQCPATEVASPTVFEGTPRAQLHLYRYCDGDQQQAKRLYGELTMRVVEFRHMETTDGRTSLNLPGAVRIIHQKFAAELSVGDRVEVQDQTSGTTLAIVRRIE